MKIVLIIISVMMLSSFLPTAESCLSSFINRRKPFEVQLRGQVQIDKEWFFTGSEDPTTTETDIPVSSTTEVEVSTENESTKIPICKIEPCRSGN